VPPAAARFPDCTSSRHSRRRSRYAAAKGAQIGLARSWARELAPLGITVNMVATAEEMGTLEDVAHAVSLLASEAAGFITGQRIAVDGGLGFTPVS
jgi:3-oxoacyl-[acyl-carrier protein] reductase